MFIFKKIVGSLLMPLPFALLLVVVGFVLYWRVARKSQQSGNGQCSAGKTKFARVLMISGFVIILLASNGTVARWLIAPLERIHPPYAEQPVKAVLVLGSYHRSAPGIPVTSFLENDGLYRLAEGIRIALMHDDIPLIVSGYAFRDAMSQAQAYRLVAIALGFPEKRIVLLESGRDTFEEMQGVSRIVGEQPLALVTSAYHMPRSMAAAKHNLLHPVAAPAWYNVKPSADADLDLWALVPSTKALMLTARAMHEYLGIVWYRLTDRL
jgi:uncharacterized SAM-binding protein YcdF (DUF218 family)